MEGMLQELLQNPQIKELINNLLNKFKEMCLQGG